MSNYHLMLNEAKKCSEGYHLQLLIQDEVSNGMFATFIRQLIILRGSVVVQSIENGD